MQGGYFKTKRVHIFVNGHPQSKAFYIHPRCRLGWNAILDCFSRTLRPNFGAIRVVRTIDGRRVIEGFNDLQHEGKYVACGLEPFRPIRGGYLSNSEICAKNKMSEYYPTEDLSPDEQKKYPCLIETMRKGRTIIYVYANGKIADPKKVVLIKSDYEAWGSILTHIGIILDIPEGVKGMYTVFGQPLCSPYEIQHGGYYVAIPFGASFKPMRYLISQRSNSYHESSPMVTKEVYISAAKTCTKIDGIKKKRRRSKSIKVKENTEEFKLDPQDRFEHHVTIEGTAIRMKEGKRKWDTSEKYKSFLKKRLTGYPGNLFLGNALQRIETPETLDQQRVTVDSVFQGYRHSDKDTDIEFHENEVHITNYFQKEEFTQTSTIFLEASYDEDNALILKQKKYFLVPEKELEKFGHVNRSEWYTGLLDDSSEINETARNEEDKKEIELVAGAVVCVIIKASEKIANRSIFGKTSSELSDVGSKLSLIPDTLQPKSRSKDLMRESTPHGVTEKQTPVVSNKALRLSVPIGRPFTEEEKEHLKKETSSNVGDTSLTLHSLDKEYTPLTPSHNMSSGSEKLMYLQNIEQAGDLSKQESLLLKHLKRDSVGFQNEYLNSAEIGKRSRVIESDDNDESEEDEWKKLDILEDFGILINDDMGGDEDFELLPDEEAEMTYDDSSFQEEYAHDDEENDYLEDRETDIVSEQSQIEENKETTDFSDVILESGDEADDELSFTYKVEDIEAGEKPGKNMPQTEEMASEYSQSETSDVTEYPKPVSFSESLESRRITINTWDHPVETVLKEKFEEELEEAKFGDQPATQTFVEEAFSESQKVHIIELPISDESEQKTIEEQRRSLMNFLRMRIEIALNASLRKLEDDV